MGSSEATTPDEEDEGGGGGAGLLVLPVSGMLITPAPVPSRSAGKQPHTTKTKPKQTPIFFPKPDADRRTNKQPTDRPTNRRRARYATITYDCDDERGPRFS